MAADEDLVQWNGASVSLVFDGSAESIAAGLDLDGAHDAPTGASSASRLTPRGGVSFDDEDVLLFDPAGPSWSLVHDGSAQHPELAAADVEAVALPEPDEVTLLAAGLAGLALLRRLSGRGRSPGRKTS